MFKWMSKKSDKSFDNAVVQIGDEFFICNIGVARHIDDLKQTILKLELKNSMLENELSEIKPILERPDLRPAVSKCCSDCKYVVLSGWNGQVLRCKKDAVCEDYIEREKEND